MKLIIQIPCYNEAQTLPLTFHDLPKEIKGIDRIEVMVINDGSTDNTPRVAETLGVDHIVTHIGNKGLAAAFASGIDACLRLGADIIVNTDGDNQYSGKDIPKLITPILEGKADMVIGNRQTDSINHFSTNKKMLQKLGSFVVRTLSGTKVPDAVSGFRAFSREAALKMNIVTSYSYTVETIIQAGKKDLEIACVDVKTNGKTRESHLASSIPSFISRQAKTMLRSYAMYKPLRTFIYIGGALIGIGLIPSVRFLYYYFNGQGGGHVQSLILSAILFIVGFQVLMIGILGDVISFNRKLIENTLVRVKRLECEHISTKGKDGVC